MSTTRSILREIELRDPAKMQRERDLQRTRLLITAKMQEAIITLAGAVYDIARTGDSLCLTDAGEKCLNVMTCMSEIRGQIGTLQVDVKIEENRDDRALADTAARRTDAPLSMPDFAKSMIESVVRAHANAAMPVVKGGQGRRDLMAEDVIDPR